MNEAQLGLFVAMMVFTIGFAVGLGWLFAKWMKIRDDME